MNSLLYYWPRQIAFPNRILVNNKTELFKSLSQYNKIVQKIYYSIYDCDASGNFNRAKLDKIGFDLDGVNRVEAIKKLHYKFIEYKHLMIFSTKGFWFYIFTKNYNTIQYTKDCLYNAAIEICNKTNLGVGEGENYDIDSHVVGDIARIARLPLSYDTSRNLFCIPITIEDLNLGLDYIKSKAKVQDFNFVYYGSKLFNIAKYDYLSISNTTNLSIPDYEYNLKIDNDILKEFLPCVQNCILNTPLKGHNKHWVDVTIYLKEMGFSQSQVRQILKPHLEKHLRNDGLGKNDWEHYVKYDHLPDYIFKHDYFFPTCNKLFRDGFCLGKCKYYNKGIYK